MCNEARVVSGPNSQIKYLYFDDFVLLGCDATSLSIRFPMSQENTLPSYDTNANPVSRYSEGEFSFSGLFKTS
jgi:hypothetical protein